MEGQIRTNKGPGAAVKGSGPCFRSTILGHRDVNRPKNGPDPRVSAADRASIAPSEGIAGKISSFSFPECVADGYNER